MVLLLLVLVFVFASLDFELVDLIVASLDLEVSALSMERLCISFLYCSLGNKKESQSLGASSTGISKGLL